MQNMTAGQFAARARVNLQTIRYYEGQRLLPDPERDINGYRRYTNADLARLSFIKEAKALGFSLDEVRELLDLRVDSKNSCSEVMKVADRHLIVVRRKLDELTRIEAALKNLIKSCHGKGPRGDCPILQALEQ